MNLNERLTQIESLAATGHESAVFGMILELLPEFHPPVWHIEDWQLFREALCLHQQRQIGTLEVCWVIKTICSNRKLGWMPLPKTATASAATVGA